MLYRLILFCIFSMGSSSIFAANIGLLIMATGKYIQFVDPLIESAEKHLCKDHNVTYYVFTDSKLPSTDRVIYIPQKRLGWPYDTMNRYHAYLGSKDILKTQDYLFACDADMLFVGDVGNEILGKLVATQHPGFVGKRGTYETNPASTACIFSHEGQQYFAGGFYGAERKEFLNILRVNIKNIDDDLSKGFIAVWHDESHWNRYCVDHKPTVILNPSYCYPENRDLPYPKKLIALNKNHKKMRSK